ncbi:MAG: glucuronate isomerase [Lachnospiraceae bacterium]|jgi:glucuronate isomerase|nr:glucuronate isomerase [Lachnospiraceae bacterium]
MEFITEDFLLNGDTARILYHEMAADLPIIDYHCHIQASHIAENKSFDNLTQVWLADDHYKWTALRWNGVVERLITGDADDYEKFLAYARTLPACIGNPLHHWSHLELKKYFGYHGHLTEDTAPEVWDLANSRLGLKGLRARDFMLQAKVEKICTTDDPADDLKWHKRLAEEDFFVKVYPAFRPDKAIEITKPEFLPYLERLGEAAGVRIDHLDSLLQVFLNRLDAFETLGCRVSDHGLTKLPWAPARETEVRDIFFRRLGGEALSDLEAEKYQTFILSWLAKQYARRGWVMQLHFGVLRNVSPTLYEALGEDAGGDAMGDTPCGEKLAGLLWSLERKRALPKMILYSINPGDNAVIDTLAGCFENGEARGKIQHGCAWWFNDTKTGMEAHLQTLASLSVLGSFVGMLTDSRSFLSYTRHDYFRRILCEYIGGLADRGEYPKDYKWMEKIIRGICYENAKEYFGF